MILDLILNALRLKLGIKTDEELADYLVTLQEPVKALRRTYLSNPEKVDYSKPEVQVAYLIAYFPHHAALLYHVLSKHSDHFDRYKYSNHHLMLYGGGPCPELIGYLAYAKLSGFLIKEKIKVNIVDVAADIWAFARNMNLGSIAPRYGLNTLVADIDVHQIDFSTSSSQTISSQTPSIVVFQNCLNESAGNKHPHIAKEFLQIFNAMQSGSTLLILDIGGYPKVLKLIEGIEKSLASANNAVILRSVNDSYEVRDFSFVNLPELISTNLLNRKDGLIPRKYIKFIYSLIYKQ